MKWTQLILFVFVVKSSSLFCQTVSSDFLNRKRTIDSVALSIDANQSLLTRRIIGVDSLWGAYKGIIYYNTDVKKPDKIKYDFELDSPGSKVFYYKDGLIKILDKRMHLYYANGILLTSNGFVIDPASTKNLLHFEMTTRNMFVNIFNKN